MVTAVAGGAILAVLTDTTVPEAVEGTRAGTGLIAAAGFLTARALGRLRVSAARGMLGGRPVDFVEEHPCPKPPPAPGT